MEELMTAEQLVARTMYLLSRAATIGVCPGRVRALIQHLECVAAYSTPIPPPIPVQTLPAIPDETRHPLHSKPYRPFQSKVGHPFQNKPATQAG